MRIIKNAQVNVDITEHQGLSLKNAKSGFKNYQRADELK